jgi:hypothetical protein
MTVPRTFRVWDGEDMHEPPHDYVLAGDGDLLLCLPELEKFGQHHGGDEVTLGVADEEHEVMKSTGLTAAEGTEIYEGDVVEDKYGNRGVAKWVKGGSCWKMCNYRAPNKTTAEEKLTVIGNRFENPELVKETA